MKWFLMGGYAWFVWPAYAVCSAILLWNIISPYYRHKHTINKLKQATRNK